MQFEICTCEICKKRHLTALHQDLNEVDPPLSAETAKAPERVETDVKERFAEAVSAASNTQYEMPIVPVKVRV